MDNYIVPATTRVGHIHLKVSDLERALTFYRDLLGFTETMRYGTQAVFLSAGGYHHHIGLNTWYSKNMGPAPQRAAGLYHTAFLFEKREELAAIYKRLNDFNYPLTGVADHGVSEALYLDDPDGNGVELYWDRPKEAWPKDENGELVMYTKELNLQSLLSILA
jgi:catechol 2,3-dioxygenase